MVVITNTAEQIVALVNTEKITVKITVKIIIVIRSLPIIPNERDVTVTADYPFLNIHEKSVHVSGLFLVIFSRQ
jgi:hypothetical protein